MRLFKRNTSERPEVSVGSLVLASDNEALGDVKSVESGLIEVQPPMGNEYWVSEHHVRSATDREVVLDFPKDQLSEFTTKAAIVETPEGTKKFDEIRDAVLSDDEQSRQRERMERELAEQRRRIQG
ncbi:MAG TPA: hypothetical protein VFY90_04525 [Tepidiformaceae bacterium]|nr:hypothetical protein [Tepidiformaceae bacterium]